MEQKVDALRVARAAVEAYVEDLGKMDDVIGKPSSYTTKERAVIWLKMAEVEQLKRIADVLDAYASINL